VGSSAIRRRPRAVRPKRLAGGQGGWCGWRWRLATVKRAVGGRLANDLARKVGG